MKLLLRITPMVLVILGLFFIIGCEDTDDEEINPLVGTWDFSNMEKTVLYTHADSTIYPFASPGDTLGDGPTTVTWTEFSAMGVSGTVTMLEDGSFTLSGNFPLASDTLGVLPTITELTDGGTWSEGTLGDYPTLTIDGAFYDLGGVMTLSDDETVISLVYAATVLDSFVVPVPAGPMGIMMIAMGLNEESTTTLGFTKQ